MTTPQVVPSPPNSLLSRVQIAQCKMLYAVFHVLKASNIGGKRKVKKRKEEVQTQQRENRACRSTMNGDECSVGEQRGKMQCQQD